MSKPQPPKSAKLVISVLLKDKQLLAGVTEKLSQAFGPVDMASRWYIFDYTDYYTPEMGSPLHRRLLVFHDLIEQSALAAIKVRTNEIEQEFACDGNRRLNLDPGYLLYERFVLATGKNFTHRIYLGDMIYADLTLIFQKGEFQPLVWTYPDYAEPDLRAFLLQVRKKYTFDIIEAEKSIPK